MQTIIYLLFRIAVLVTYARFVLPLDLLHIDWIISFLNNEIRLVVYYVVCELLSLPLKCTQYFPTLLQRQKLKQVLICERDLYYILEEVGKFMIAWRVHEICGTMKDKL